MELIYTMRRKPMKNETPNLESLSGSTNICKISAENIVAFTSSIELNIVSSVTTYGCHVYVLDINVPWEIYKVVTTVRQVSSLQWDPSCRYLLICTVDGEILVYSCRQMLLNDWYCVAKGSLAGEHIVGACFFHNGLKLVQCADVKVDQPCTERFVYANFKPTLRGFGGMGLEGGLIVTSSGLLAAFTLSDVGNEHSRLVLKTESLAPTRQFVSSADFTHKSNGEVSICWWSDDGQRVRAVNATVRANPFNVELKAAPTLFLSRESQQADIVMVKWSALEDSNTLYVVRHGSVEAWSLVDREYPIHHMFLKVNTTPGTGQKQEVYKTLCWQRMARHAWSDGRATWLTCSKMADCHVALSLSNGKLQLLSHDKLTAVSSTQLYGRNQGDTLSLAAAPPKLGKYDRVDSEWNEACMDVSWLGGLLVLIDSQSQIYLYSLPHPATDLALPTWAQNACALLEYSMISGRDPLDILLALPTNAVDTLYERITESFPRQPAAFQQYHQQSWLCLRAALSRLSSNGGHQRAGELMNTLMIHSIHNTFKSLHRPMDTTGIDKMETSVSLSEEDVTIDNSVEPVHSIRRLVQRVIDTGLLALATRKQNNLLSGLSVLRDCLFISRCWLSSRSLPIDTISAVARLLSRDHFTTDECTALLCQHGVSRGADDPPLYSVAARHNTKRPYILEYGVEPDILKTSPETITIENVHVVDALMDTIRYSYLGYKPVRWRKCGRCGARSVCCRATTAWDANYHTHCRCGGRWCMQSAIVS